MYQNRYGTLPSEDSWLNYFTAIRYKEDLIWEICTKRLWNHPETGFKEHETQKYCLEVLKKHGFEATTWPDTHPPVPHTDCFLTDFFL